MLDIQFSPKKDECDFDTINCCPEEGNNAGTLMKERSVDKAE